MEITLEMIQRKWSLPGTSLHVHSMKKIWIKTLRLCTMQTKNQKEDVLYLMQKNQEMNDNGIYCFSGLSREWYEKHREENPHFLWVEFLEQEYEQGDILNHLFEIFDDYRIAGQRLWEAVEHENALQEVIDLICEFTGNPAYVADRSYKALAMNEDNPDLPLYSIHWKRIREQGYLPFHVVASILNNEQWNPVRNAAEPILVQTKEFSTPFVVCNIRIKGKIYWQLFVCEIFQYITPGDLDLVQVCMPYLKKCLTRNQKYISLKDNYHEHFFRDVISRKLSTYQSVEEQLRALKWPMKGVYSLLEIRKADMAAEEMRNLYDIMEVQLREIGENRLVLYENRLFSVFWIKDMERYEEILGKIEKLLREVCCFGAVSDAGQGFLNLPVYAEQTEAVFRRRGTDSIEEQKHLISYQEIAFEELFSKWIEKAELKKFCVQGLQSLKNHDIACHSDYMRTLRVFLQNEQNLVKTAQILGIHRNTLVYRIEKIRGLLPCSLEDAQTRLRLLISFEIEKYLEKN